MKSIKSCLAVLMAGAVLWALGFASNASAQGNYRSGFDGRVDAKTMITVRTNESIRAREGDGRVFSGYVEGDVRSRDGNIVIPRGSPAELVVRRVSNNEVALDLDSVMINGERYGLQTDENIVSSEQAEGLGTNKRTGEFVGGGAVLGAIIGAISGGGKGAAIGAGAGAAAGAGAQILTRGRSVDVPAESLLTFQLSQPLRAGVVDHGYMRDGTHYHPGYNTDYRSSAAYDTGRQKPGYPGTVRGSINIGTDRNIRWRGPENANIFVQVDNRTPRLFASGHSGIQQASWMARGHLYVFILKDGNGNEIARDWQDLRRR